MLKNAREFSISGGYWTNVEGDYHVHYTDGLLSARQRVLSKLISHTVPEAFHDAKERYNAPRCHPATCGRIMEELMTWIRDSDQRNRFRWLFGPLGIGKSAISQTLAELCASLGIPMATFFFSRASSKRSKKKQLIETLVYQLVCCIPEISEKIYGAIQDHPAIFKRSISSQIRLLLIEPLEQLGTLRISEPRYQHVVLIIDALDECGGEMAQQSIIAELFRSILNATPLGIRILIASRPVYEIREAFRLELPSSQISVHSLGEVQDPADLKTFFDSQFQEIRSTHPLKSYLPSDWPTSIDISRLVANASGQFIYATTIMTFISCSRHRPQERLRAVLEASLTGDPEPFIYMDRLYGEVFSSVDPDTVVKALDILALVSLNSEAYPEPYISEWLTCTWIERVLGYKEGDTQVVFIDLHSLVYVPEQDGKLHLHHASLKDYIFTQSRSGRFCIHKKQAHTRIAECLIRYALRDATINERHLVYLICFHCRNSELTADLICLLRQFNLVEKTISLIDHNLREFPNPSLSEELECFFRWLDTEKRILDPEKSLFRYHLDRFEAWILTSISLGPPNVQSAMRAAFALCTSYRSKDMFSIIEDITQANVYFSRDHIASLFAQGSYLAAAATQAVLESPNSRLLDGEGYTALAQTMAEFLYSRHSRASLMLASHSPFDATKSTTAREVLIHTLSTAVPHRQLAMILLHNALCVTSNEVYKYSTGGTIAEDVEIKNRLIELAKQSLKYVKMCRIEYQQHNHVDNYEFCAILCKSNRIKSLRDYSSKGNERRQRIITQINRTLGSSTVHKKGINLKSIRRFKDRK